MITFFLLVAVHVGYTKTVQLKSFDEILNALTSGKTVKAVFHYKGCKLIRDNEEVERVPDASGGQGALFKKPPPGP
jgi:predicted amidohydrolase